jgi:hypothetical protein
MTFPSEHVMVFESKYKGVVEKKDVTKFEDDMGNMGDKVIGGVFVSFLSKNIPGKGNMFIELNKKNKPLLYVAYDNEEEFNIFFSQHCKLFINICHVFMDAEHQQNDINSILDELKFLFDMFQKNKKRLDDIKTKFMKYYNEVEVDNTTILQRLDNMLIRKKQTLCISNRVKPRQSKISYVCTTCNMEFLGKRELNKHMKSHM